MNEETQTSGHQDGATACQDSSREKERADWKRRQALQPSAGTWLSPTLPERINRLNPSERHQLSTLIRSMKLRKIIRRTLAEAFWLGEAQKPLPRPNNSMQRLRATVQAHESLMNYERALTRSVDTTTFDPVYVRSTHGDGNDSPAVSRALEQSLLIQP